MGMSRCSSGTQPPEGPPIWAALNVRPRGTPPPISDTTSRRLIPMGTSTRPVFCTFPTSAKILVPLLFSVPMELNQSAPLLMITGTLAHVSTLLMFVGLPKRPDWAGYGGRGRGMPRYPSIEAMSAVSSPHTKAPPPSLIFTRNEKPVPSMSSPSSPCASACSIASLRC